MGEQGLVGDGDGGGDGEQGLVGDGEQGVWAAGAGDYCHMSPPPLQSNALHQLTCVVLTKYLRLFQMCGKNHTCV